MRSFRFRRGLVPSILLCVTAAVITTWPTAVSATAAYSKAVLALRPAAYWRLGERSGPTAYDSSGHGGNATYVGQPLLGQPGAITNDRNTSVGFEGLGNYAVWNPPSAYSGPFTVVAWVKETQTSPYEQTFFDTRTPSGDQSFDFKIGPNREYLKVDVGNGSWWFLTGPGIPYNFQLNTWYQVAARVTGMDVTFYVNGQRLGSESYDSFGTAPLLYDQAHAVYLGENGWYSGGGEQFLGNLDEVTIYLKPLADDAIAFLYQVGVGK